MNCYVQFALSGICGQKDVNTWLYFLRLEIYRKILRKNGARNSSESFARFFHGSRRRIKFEQRKLFFGNVYLCYNLENVKFILLFFIMRQQLRNSFTGFSRYIKLLTNIGVMESQITWKEIFLWDTCTKLNFPWYMIMKLFL